MAGGPPGARDETACAGHDHLEAGLQVAALAALVDALGHPDREILHAYVVFQSDVVAQPKRAGFKPFFTRKHANALKESDVSLHP